MENTEKKASSGLGMKIGIITILVVMVIAVFAVKNMQQKDMTDGSETGNPKDPDIPGEKSAALPKLVDLGAETCIPCKMMAPILDELKREYAGRMIVEFIDVWKNPDAAKPYNIDIIPTQIFFDDAGKELFRHQGFYSKEDILSKWKELGVDFGGKKESGVVREQLQIEDTRPKETVCFMCEKTIDPKIKVVVIPTAGNGKNLCSSHCYFIFESCLLNKASVKEVKATDYRTGELVSLEKASYLYGTDTTGRPTIKAFAKKAAAESEMKTSGGNVLSLQALKEKENAMRCGFCDRAMYVQDNGSTVDVVDGPKTYGCCPHCALGVAARLQKDIVVENHDPVSGELIRIETLNGSIKSISPAMAIAWFGKKKKTDGKWGSAGCFHQWNFTSVENLKKWLGDHPMETGRQITIHKAFANKMKLTPQQIKGACKIGECK